MDDRGQAVVEKCGTLPSEGNVPFLSPLEMAACAARSLASSWKASTAAEYPR